MANYTVTTKSDTGADATAPGNLAAETADGGGLSLREAIILANKTAAKDTIDFANGLKGKTITLNGNELDIEEDLEIDGDIDGDGKFDVTVDGNGDSRVFDINGADVTLRGLKITNGFTNGSGDDGAGVSADSSSLLSIFDSEISNNRTTGNDAEGGGIDADGGLTLVRSTVKNNKTTGSGAEGGGIHFRDDATIVDSMISNNSTTGSGSEGGGLYAHGKLYMFRTTIDNNSTTSSTAEGGGLYTRIDATLTNTTIYGNQTTGTNAEGGGINARDPITLINSTVTGNKTTGSGAEGGGIHMLSGTDDLTLINSIVLGNIATNAPNDEFEANSLVLKGGNILGRNNSSTADVFQGSTDVGNTNAEKVFKQTFNNSGKEAGELKDNGGKVMTVALLGDATNPALDASKDSESAGITNDARGTAFDRSYNLKSVKANDPNQIDLGAFEIQPWTNSKGVMLGTFDKDKIRGTDGEDTIKAGGGDDKIIAGKKKDKQVGGGGDDKFVFKDVKDSKPGGGQRDKITDFDKNGDDKIALKAIDAKTGPGNQKFDFIGTSGFSGDKGELRYVKKAKKTIVKADVDGDKKAELEIELKGSMDLQADDFIL